LGNMLLMDQLVDWLVGLSVVFLSPIGWLVTCSLLDWCVVWLVPWSVHMFGLILAV